LTRSRAVLFAVAAAFSIQVEACATAPKTAGGKADIESNAAEVIVKARRNDPSLERFFHEAAGYAVFPSILKGGVDVGGAYGKGVLYEHGQAVGYCDLSQASIGLQLGGQRYSEILFFESREAVSQFKSGNFSLSAQASAVALKSGAGANAKFSEGVAIFTMNEEGLMYEASIGGQKFSYQAK
jgi:lipid-binding SYLF domain-containing protein